jgi:hypothetical protein
MEFDKVHRHACIMWYCAILGHQKRFPELCPEPLILAMCILLDGNNIPNFQLLKTIAMVSAMNCRVRGALVV